MGCDLLRRLEDLAVISSVRLLYKNDVIRLFFFFHHKIWLRDVVWWHIRTIFGKTLEKLILLHKFSHFDLLVDFQGAFLTCFAYFEEFYFSSEFFDSCSLLMDYLFHLNNSLLKSNLYQDQLILWRVFEKLKHGVHAFKISFFTPKDGFLENEAWIYFLS